MEGFECAAGSIPGTDHTKPNQTFWKNNQDAVDFFCGDTLLVGVVCDGCGSGKYSEVGAHLGARLVIKAITDYVSVAKDFGKYPDSMLKQISSVVTAQLRQIVEMGTSSAHMRNAYAAQHFLFTIVGVVITEETTLVFSFGDGVYSVNGVTEVIPSFPNNAPPYIACNFVPSDVNPELLKFEVRACLPTKDVSSVLIGTDGLADFIKSADKPLPKTEEVLGPLSQFWEEDRFVRNADMIRRRLAKANREHVDDGLILGGLLHDDTTLFVVRRSEISTQREEVIDA
jgi:hypothetical protein